MVLAMRRLFFALPLMMIALLCFFACMVSASSEASSISLSPSLGTLCGAGARTASSAHWSYGLRSFVRVHRSKYCWRHIAPSTHPGDDTVAMPSNTPRARPGSPPKRILILISDTGGGHRNSALAVSEALAKVYPDAHNITILDIFTKYAAFPFSKLIPIYRAATRHPYVWGSLYYAGLVSPIKLLVDQLCWVCCYYPFKRIIQDHDPDLVISMHPLCTNVPVGIVKELNNNNPSRESKQIRFATVVTDLGSAHSTWFDDRVDCCIVPCDSIKSIAQRHGLQESTGQLVVRGLPIRSAFISKKPDRHLYSGLFSEELQLDSKDTLRRRLGLHPKPFTLLLMSGGEGVGNLRALADAVMSRLGSAACQADSRLDQRSQPSSVQVVIICGNNKQAFQELATRRNRWNDEYSKQGFRVVVTGYVENVHEYMKASDLLVTKAGPGTIAEAVASALPMIIWSYLPGQARF
jgi:1,2-diacylglycerol 3-beta-galactosyltransferase